MTLHHAKDPLARWAKVFHADGTRSKIMFESIDDDRCFGVALRAGPRDNIIYIGQTFNGPPVVEYHVPWEDSHIPVFAPGWVYERYDLTEQRAVWRRAF